MDHRSDGCLILLYSNKILNRILWVIFSVSALMLEPLSKELFLPPDGSDVAEYMKQHLKPVIQPLLADTVDPCPVFYNVVSNVKLDLPYPLRLLRVMSLPNAEIKSGFGAAILRYIHSLTKDQAKVPQLKSSSVTHLCFAKGALGSTGNRSEDEARLGCHEFRLLLYTTFGVKTNFRRFTIPNMVCSSSLGYCINLAKMHAADQVNTDYYPDLFPGLFYYYKYASALRSILLITLRFVYKDRQVIHQRLTASTTASAGRKVKLLEEDLIQLHRTTTTGVSKDASDEAIRAQVKNMLDSYLPKFKYIVVLVFIRGKVVGLGPQDRQAATEAFKHVAEVSKQFRIEDNDTAEFLRRRKAQDRLMDKNEMLEEKQRVSYVNPFSRDAQRKMDEIANRIEDETERKARIKKLLEEELSSKKKQQQELEQEPVAGSNNTQAKKTRGRKRKNADGEATKKARDDEDELQQQLLEDLGGLDDDPEWGTFHKELFGEDSLPSGQDDESEASVRTVTSTASGRVTPANVMQGFLSSIEKSRKPPPPPQFEDMPDLTNSQVPDPVFVRPSSKLFTHKKPS